MTDVKIIAKPRKAKKTGRVTVDRPLREGEMIWKTRYENGLLSSNTAGSIAAAYTFSSTVSTEYSGISTIFTLCRLVRAELTIVPRYQVATSLQGSILMGTHMSMNATTFTVPTSIVSVANLKGMSELTSFSTRILKYRVPVPKNLEFTLLGSDCPTLPVPYAGSPGAALVWGDNFSPSTDYFVVHTTVWYHVKARA